MKRGERETVFPLTFSPFYFLTGEKRERGKQKREKKIWKLKIKNWILIVFENWNEIRFSLCDETNSHFRLFCPKIGKLCLQNILNERNCIFCKIIVSIGNFQPALTFLFSDFSCNGFLNFASVLPELRRGPGQYAYLVFILTIEFKGLHFQNWQRILGAFILRILTF